MSDPDRPDTDQILAQLRADLDLAARIHDDAAHPTGGVRNALFALLGSASYLDSALSDGAPLPAAWAQHPDTPLHTYMVQRYRMRVGQPIRFSDGERVIAMLTCERVPLSEAERDVTVLVEMPPGYTHPQEG